MQAKRSLGWEMMADAEKNSSLARTPKIGLFWFIGPNGAIDGWKMQKNGRLQLHDHGDHRQSMGSGHGSGPLHCAAWGASRLGTTLVATRGFDESGKERKTFSMELMFQFTNWLQSGANGQRFRQNQSDSFTLKLPAKLGIIRKLTLGHECHGYGRIGEGRAGKEEDITIARIFFTRRCRHIR